MRDINVIIDLKKNLVRLKLQFGTLLVKFYSFSLKEAKWNRSNEEFYLYICPATVTVL